MALSFEQGDILKIENINYPVLVVSTNFFHGEEQAIVCPIVQTGDADPLHIKVETEEVQGFVYCEQMRLVDLQYGGYKKLTRIAYADTMNITDAIQGIFDY